MKATDSLTHLLGVGESYAKKLKNLNLETIQDLLDHFPRTHLDYSKTTDIKDLVAGEPACIRAFITSFSSIRTRGKLTIQKATITDHTGKLNITWFNQPYLKEALVVDNEYFFTTTPELYQNKITLSAPDFEIVKDKQIHTQRIIPIYALTQGITQKWLRHKVHLALSLVEIPEILERDDFIDLNTAYHQIHFPESQLLLKKAKERLAFNDLLSIYLKSELTKLDWQTHTTTSFNVDKKLHQKLLSSLPYKLTKDQLEAIDQIFTDLKKTKPMNRLLQGDVGSGKTIVALSAALQILNQNASVIVMAPTQVLAVQHHENFSTILKPFKIKPVLITGGNKQMIRKKTNLYIGTHALLHQSELLKEKTGLIITDEQHRFGVLQRSHFLNQKHLPHSLTMSATPIPRTIALSHYGHLDITDIKTKPKDRKVIKTWYVPESKRTNSYDWIKTELKSGRQAFIICPLIDDSEHESLKSLKAVTTEYERLISIFKGFKLALLHGKMKPKEKDQLLLDFKNHKFDLLVSTPVIEVGIDITNANIIVIEGSERFGLASLHQLRGRVGRGEYQSYCLLFCTNNEPSSVRRLKLLETINDGLKLARIDLRIRGMGAIFGTKQSGHLDTEFQAFWNTKLKAQAQKTAKNLVKDKNKAEGILILLNPSLAKKVSAN